MKKFFGFLVASGLLCGVAMAEVLKIGTNAEYPPFEFIDENRTITGFDMELVSEMAKRVGVELEILNMSFDGLIPALKSGKIDLAVSAMSATEERKKVVDFTTPYYQAENLFIRQKGNTELGSKEALNGKKVGVQLGTIQETAMRNAPGVNVVPTEVIFTAIMSLKNGKIDAVCVDSSVGIEYIKKNDDIEEFYRESDGSDGFSFAFDKGKHTELIAKFDTALDEMKKDGSYDKLLEKYNLK